MDTNLCLTFIKRIFQFRLFFLYLIFDIKSFTSHQHLLLLANRVDIELWSCTLKNSRPMPRIEPRTWSVEFNNATFVIVFSLYCFALSNISLVIWNKYIFYWYYHFFSSFGLTRTWRFLSSWCLGEVCFDHGSFHPRVILV